MVKVNNPNKPLLKTNTSRQSLKPIFSIINDHSFTDEDFLYAINSISIQMSYIFIEAQASLRIICLFIFY